MNGKSTWGVCLIFILLCLVFSHGKRVNNALIVSDIQTSDEDDVVVVEEDVTNDVFQPTTDWKTIERGQSIPKGLHVRINMATGLKEARLVPEHENSDKTKLPDSPQTRFSPDELKEALKAIKAEDIANVKPQESKAKFRSLEELKKEFSDLKINVKSETDILSDLLDRYKTCRTEENQVKILEDLEYIVHQFDVAQDFVRLDGLHLLLPDLNSTAVAVRSMVCTTLGAAMQGNPLVQIGVLEHNGLSLLIRLVLLDPSLTVRAKALFAMSCLLRNFPFAQQRFVENGGIQLMASILQDIGTTSTISMKIKLKVVTLLNDLLVEHESALGQLSNGEKASKMYLEFPLRKQLVDHGFCELLGNLLPVLDIDLQERVIHTMEKLRPECTFKKQHSTLRKIGTDIQKQIELDELDEDLKQLLNKIKILLDESHNKDEL